VIIWGHFVKLGSLWGIITKDSYVSARRRVWTLLLLEGSGAKFVPSDSMLGHYNGKFEPSKYII